MEDLYMAFSVVLPLCIYMLTGFFIRKAGWMKYDNFAVINKVIFKLFIPLTLFFNVYHAELSEAINVKLFGYVIAGVLGACIIAWILVAHVVHTPSIESVMIQGIYRSNYVLFGTTIGIAICGEGNIAPLAALSAIVVPLFNILAVIVLESFRGGSVQPGKVILGIIKNPLVLAGVFGILAGILQIKIPVLIEKPLTNIGDIATPLALICLGGMLSAASMRRHFKYLIAVDAGKLIILPAIMLVGGILLGFRGVELVAVLAVFASPTAVASVPMAQAMGGDGDLAGEIVVTTSVGCIFTLFLFVLIMKSIGVI